MDTDATATPRSPELGNAIAAVVAWALAFVAMLLATAALTGARPGQEDAPTLSRLGRELQPNNANAKPVGDAMVVANRRDAPLVILGTSVLPFRAADYGRVIVDAEPLPRHVEVALIWVRRDEPGHPYEQALALDHDRLVPTTLDTNPDWRGDIGFIAIGVKGVMTRPWTLKALSLEPMGTSGVAADIARGWTTFEGWDGRSINVIFGGRGEQRVWLPPLVFAASAVSALVVWGLARRRGSRAGVWDLALPFLLGWLVLDVRWQGNLVEQTGVTRAEFGGRTWEEKHLAMEDGEMFRFIQAAVAKLPAAPVRIFATSDFEYFRRRAGYHLYPHNVLAYVWTDPSLLKPGDHVLLYQKADVHFDPGKRLLVWKAGHTLPVTPLLAQRGAGVFVVREPEAAAQ
jgi:hypothetical protein